MPTALLVDPNLTSIISVHVVSPSLSTAPHRKETGWSVTDSSRRAQLLFWLWRRVGECSANPHSCQAPRRDSIAGTFSPLPRHYRPPSAMEVIANATSFASPLANADLKIQAGRASGILGRVLAQLNPWSVAVTLFLLLVTYDQCEQYAGPLPSAQSCGLTWR